MTDKAIIENHGRLKVSNILGVPQNLLPTKSCPSNSTKQRWFDNYAHRVDGGMLTIRNFRFGGESMGITAIVNHRAEINLSRPLLPRVQAAPFDALSSTRVKGQPSAFISSTF